MHITIDNVQVVFARQLKNGVRRAILFLRAVNPVYTELDGQLAIGCAECSAAHASPKLLSCLDDKEIHDSLCGQRVRSNDARNIPAKYKYLRVWHFSGQGSPGGTAGSTTRNLGRNRSWKGENRAYK